MAKIKISSTLSKTLWGRFVRLYGGCFYDESAFLDYYRKKVTQVKRLAFFDGKDLVAALPAGIVTKDNQKQLLSPYSASFGGLILRDCLKIAQVLEIFESLLLWSKKANLKKIIIRQRPSIYSRDSASELLDWAYNYSGFKTKVTDITLYVSCQADFLEKCSKTARNLIRRGKREGFKFQETADLTLVYDLISLANQKKGHGLTLKKSEIEDIKSIFPEKVKYFVVSKNNETIAASIIYLLSPQTILVMFWAYQEKWARLAPTYFLIERLVNWGKIHQFSSLDFGNATIDSEPFWGVVDFKEKFNPLVATKKIYEKNI